MAETRVKEAAPADGLPGCSGAATQRPERPGHPPPALMLALSPLAAPEDPRQAGAAEVSGQVKWGVRRPAPAHEQILARLQADTAHDSG